MTALVLADKQQIADDVVELVLHPSPGQQLAAWDPGAHIDIVLPNGMVRQYSLCGDNHNNGNYRVAVLREPSGRGGSKLIHDQLAVGEHLTIRGPRNNFGLIPSPRYLFIAGGIGITPILPMIAAVDAGGADWRLLFGGRSRSSMAFVEELSTYGERVTVVPEDEKGRLELEPWLDTPQPSTMVYCCGPPSLLAAVESLCQAWPRGSLRVERFTADHPQDRPPARGFEVVLARSGLTLTVPPDKSILEVVEDAGLGMLSSCTEGLCGTCETAVLDGVPEHRDLILDDKEQAEGDVIMICVSRSCTPRLVLDL